MTLHIRRFFILSLLLAFVPAACSQKSDATDQQAGGAVGKTTPEPTDSLTITLTGADSVSVLELLKADHLVEVHESAMGAFVKAIDSVENRQGYFWVYSVNDSTGKVAADKRLTSDGDTIEWHYRKMGE